MNNVFANIEIDFLCAFVFGLMIHRVKVAADGQLSQVTLLRILICNFLMVIFDGLSFVIAFLSYKLGWNVFVCRLVNGIYFITVVVGSIMWFYYVLILLHSPLIRSKKMRYLLAVPAFAIIVMAVFSIFGFNTLFFIGENYQYHRGALYFIQPIVSYAYILTATVLAIIKSIDINNYVDRKQYLEIAYFPLLPILFGVVQFFFPAFNTVCIGNTLAILWFFLSNQNQKISIDSLTQLNNRNQLKKYIMYKMKKVTEGKHLFILMIDVDYFKKINDKYGHLEGDEALRRVAMILKTTCNVYNSFLCRYGGDEFTMVFDADYEDELFDLCRMIFGELATMNVAVKSPYDLSLTIGYAEYKPYMKTPDDFIALADKNLYEKKNARIESK